METVGQVPEVGIPEKEVGVHTHRVGAILLLLTAGLAAVSGVWYLSSLTEPGRVCVIVLLGLSTSYCIVLALLSLIVPGLQAGWFVWLFSSLEAAKTCLLAGYVLTSREQGSWLSPHARQSVALLSLLLVLLVVGGAVVVMWHILEDAAGRGSRTFDSRLGRLADNPFVVLTGFFVIFLYATYLLGFALAFHNRGDEGPGLYATSLGWAAEAWRSESGGSTSSKKTVPASCTGFQTDSEGVRSLVFRKGHASLECEGAILAFLRQHPDVKDGGGGVVAGGLVDTEPECQADLGKVDPRQNRTIVVHNVETLRCLRDQLVEDGDNHRRRLILLGHATGAHPGGEGPFRNNYELSMARAQQAQRVLSELLDEASSAKDSPHPPEVEWLLSPVSSENTFLTSGGSRLDGLGESVDRKLTVEVAVHSLQGPQGELEVRTRDPKPPGLSLLDYMYFMIYTITTTGYGDLVPVTPVAKFITVIANLFEVFFLVIVLNVLLELLRKKRTA